MTVTNVHESPTVTGTREREQNFAMTVTSVHVSPTVTGTKESDDNDQCTLKSYCDRNQGKGTNFCHVT